MDEDEPMTKANRLDPQVMQLAQSMNLSQDK